MTMTEDNSRVQIHRLAVATCLAKFIEEQVLPGSGVEADAFWRGFDAIAHDLSPRNAELLAERDRLQNDLDAWHDIHPGPVEDLAAYRSFLSSIGYLASAVGKVEVSTENVDTELTTQAGPQLVVPLLNARYALNAANARWGSLFDALYGTDVIPEGEEGAAKIAPDGSLYNPRRGEKVIAYARAFLDDVLPLRDGSHSAVVAYKLDGDGRLVALLADGRTTALADENQFVGYQGSHEDPSGLLFVHHRLHIHLSIDRLAPIGRSDPAGLADVLLEAALTTILDLEDSIAAVDALDKVRAYDNWLRILQATLTEEVNKAGKVFTRRLHEDRIYLSREGEVRLPGRALLFLRNVGHLMTNPAVLLDGGKEIPEGILDAVVTIAIALHDLRRPKEQNIGNSRSGSIYIVKPKMHGPTEVAFTCDLFSRVESLLGLPQNTVKLGIMDEERRTSVNLKACIAAAATRVAFINTGFLDRTGDEIHTAMRAGPMLRKGDMKTSAWLAAYERRNVLIGLSCGLRGRAQIGKGMWAMPDLMAAMVELKIAHVKSGANTAWVPSPTAATLHALHYHRVDVTEVQGELLKDLQLIDHESDALLDPLLHFPVVKDACWSEEEVREELENNCQGILGYVVRWIDQGIGCSKVPDIHNVGLMEDRATLRISSQHVTNWLLHGVVSENQVRETLKRMAKIVDGQNKQDPHYQPMGPDFDQSLAFQAATDLIFQGLEQPNGYTEPLLHGWRLKVKAARHLP
eukprot:gene6355-7007_t